MILLLGCNSQKTTPEDALQTVKIAEALEAKQDIMLSEIIDGDIEYVPLETNENCLIADNPRFYLNKNEIIVFTNQYVYIFDRKTGKFLQEIGHFGRDPGGYQSTVYSFPYDEKNDLYYLRGWEQQVYLRYNSSGKLVDEITAYSNTKEPDIQNSDFGEMINSIAPLNDTCFVGHVWNLNGRQKTKLIVFNENNHRIKTYPQYKTFEWNLSKDGLVILHWDGWFYEYKNELNYFERFTDTVYSVSLENLKPRYILEGSNFIESIYETERFLLFNLRREGGLINGIFDKKSNETKIARKPEGLENDVDNFVPFFLSSANNEGKVVGFQQSYIIEAWFKENPEKAANSHPIF